MKDVTESVRERIASLQAQRDRLRQTDAELKTQQNRLAYLTASVFLVIDNGQTIDVFGVSTEIKCQAYTLFLSLGPGNVANIVHHFSASLITLRIAAGGQLSFTLTDDECRNEIGYHIRAFAQAGEAAMWAKERREQNTSR